MKPHVNAAGTEQLEILQVRYERVPIEAFTPLPGAESATSLTPRG